MRRSHLAVALIVAAAIAALALWWSRRDRESEAATTATREPAALATPAPPIPIPPAVVVTEAPPAAVAGTDTSDAASRAVAVAKLDETIALYRATMTYPLWSRPADGSNAHLTHWNRAIETGQPFAEDADQRTIEARAGIDRIFAAPDAAVTLVVTARYVDDGSPAKLDELDAQLQWRDREHDVWVTVQPVPLRATADGWTGAVVPSQIAALRAPIREARLVAYVRIGEFSRELTLDFAYAIDPPVVVHGLASDRVIDGDLVLGLDVELATAATVGLQATLFAADGTTAIAVFDDRIVPTRAGRQVVPVRFFGKVLRERGVGGPYRLGAIHGYVHRPDLVPDQLFFDRADLPALTTAAHPASGFAADPYHSPEVDARIAHYLALRAALGAGQSPPPPPR